MNRPVPSAMVRNAAIAALLACACAASVAGPAPQPLAKTGACPSGYSTSGDYCLASSSDARLAVPKTGPCPSGFSTSGAHCLSSR